MLKRICASCLVLIMILSLAAIAPVYAADESDVQLLSDLGIISLTQKKGLIQRGFNRSEFARVLCVMEKNKTLDVSTEDAASYAKDIESDANFESIATVLSLGYMETDIDGNFNPGKPLTKRDAVYALISILGYKRVVQSEGGSDAAYYNMAQKLKLFKGVEIGNDEKLTEEETAAILANAMSVRIYPTENIDLDGMCLWEYWDLSKSTGRILANSNLGLMTEATAYRRVNIDGKIYYTELLIPDEYVGSTVTYYTMPGDKGTEVVSIWVDKESDFLTIDANDIYAVEDLGKSLRILYDNNKKLTIPKSGFVVVNGKTRSPGKKLFDAFKSGTVTFVDSDSSGKYDLIHMTMLVQNVIDGVNAELETLTTKFNGGKIDLKEFDSCEIYLGKKAADVSQLMGGMPVGIACDAFTINADGSITYDYAKAEYIRLYASLRSVTGIVEMTDGESVTVDEMEQPLGDTYFKLVEDKYISAIEPGDYVTIYMDTFGEVVYYEIDLERSSLKYGYLIAAAGNASGLDSTTKVKIMDTNGNFHIFESYNSNFILDGKKVKSGNTSYTVAETAVDLTNRQLVRYRAAEGVLYELDTAKVVQDDKSLSEDLKFNPYVTGNTEYKIRSGAVDRKFAFKDDCVLFVDDAPLDDKNPPEYLFSIGDMGVDRVSYYMAGYDSDDDNRLGCIVRWAQYGLKDGDAITSPLNYHEYRGFVVERVAQAVGKDGEEGWYLSLAGYSGQDKYFVPADRVKLYTTQSASDWGGENLNIYKKDPKDMTSVLKSGDIIRFNTDTYGNIVFIEKIFDFESHKDGTTPFINRTHVYGFANLKKVSGDYLIYNFDGEESDYITKKIAKFPIVPLYEVSTGKVKMVDISQVPSMVTGNTVKAFLRDYNSGYTYDHIFYLYD